MIEPFYVADEDYWMTDAPPRMGDLIGSPIVNGEQWHAGLLIHPTCELPKSRTREVQLVRIRPLSDITDGTQQGQIVVGWKLSTGEPTIAFANTFYVAPTGAPRDTAMFADFTQIGQAEKTSTLDQRAAAMGHDCRVRLIRRMLYFRYRWLLPVAKVQELEASRIMRDPEFVGDRPVWAD